MELKEVMAKLEEWQNPVTKKTLLKHGAREPFFGVSISDLKKIVKKVKKDHNLAMQLYATGNSDAMYLAALISDETKMTKDELRKWANEAYWYYLSEYAVAWAAAESPYAEELANEWIASDEENLASSGWATWSNIVILTPDEELDLDKIRSLIERAEQDIHEQENRVSYAKNAFILNAGASVKALTEEVMEVGKRMGKVKVNMGETSCKVPFIPDYLAKLKSNGRIGFKKKTVKC